MNELPYRTSEFADYDDAIDRAFGKRLMSTERLQYTRDNNTLVGTVATLIAYYILYIITEIYSTMSL